MPGDNKQSWWQRILMGGAIAEAPSVMTAAGHKIEKDGTVTVDNQNDAGVKQLRSSLPVIGSAPILSVAATNPGTYPWIAKNVVLPVLGGEVVNETTRKVSDNKYKSFGDFVYHNTPLSRLKDGTDSNIFVKGFSEMLNPAYLFPYGKTVGYVMDGARTLSNAYNNLPVKIKFNPRENFRYRNVGNNEAGINDLLKSGEVRPAAADPNSKIITKDFVDAFFGHKGQMVNPEKYPGKYFLGAKDINNFVKKYRNQWGYVSKTPLTYNDVTINRRIFPKMTNSPYIEWAPGKYTEYNTPLKILQKNEFLTPNTPDNGFKLYSGFPIKISSSDMKKGNPDWFYRLDFEGEGAFKNGATIKDGMLIPGKAKIPEQKSYLWFNLGKPYTSGINGRDFNRAFIFPKDKVQLLKVRDQKVPIGQWNGSSGFVLPTEYVSDSPIDLSVGAIYHLTDDGWRLHSGIPIKMPSKSIITDNTSGKLLYTPDEIVKNGDFAKGKEMAIKFFEHPVVKDSYKHNQELAKRLGIILPDKNPAEIVKLPVRVRYGNLGSNEIANVAQSFYGDPDAIITMNWRGYPLNDLRQAVIHENLHRGFYGAPKRPFMMHKEYYDGIYKPEYIFYDWKTRKLFKPEYDGYLMHINDGEAAVNFIDLGRDLGLKLGQKYPGYDIVKNMLENYNGFKKFIIPNLNMSKAGLRHVWDAMTGKYFTVPITTIGIGATLLNNTNKN